MLGPRYVRAFSFFIWDLTNSILSESFQGYLCIISFDESTKNSITRRVSLIDLHTYFRRSSVKKVVTSLFKIPTFRRSLNEPTNHHDNNITPSLVQLHSAKRRFQVARYVCSCNRFERRKLVNHIFPLQNRHMSTKQLRTNYRSRGVGLIQIFK